MAQKKKPIAEEIKVEQGSKEWRIERLGKWTATRIKDLMSAGKSKDAVFGETAITMMAEVAGERQLAEDIIQDDEKFKEWSDLQCRENSAMRHGHEWENIARINYEIEKSVEVQQVGMFQVRGTMMACSPDGIILDKKGKIEGGVEIKCPSTNKTFMRYKWFIKDAETLKKEKPEYYWQIQHTMMCLETKWWDLVVYSPFHNGGLHIVRIERNDEDCDKIVERYNLAEKMIEELNGKGHERGR